MLPVRFSIIILLPLIFFACSETESESIESKVSQLIENKEFDEALELIHNADHNTEAIRLLKIQVHLAYGTFLTHEADHLAMRDRMSNALRHFRKVKELDENNSQANSHIELIESIYQQMGRDIPEGVAD